MRVGSRVASHWSHFNSAELAARGGFYPDVVQECCAAAADGSWDIKFKGGADRAAFCKWLAKCNVSLDHVLACDGTWFTCSSVDGLILLNKFPVLKDGGGAEGRSESFSECFMNIVTLMLNETQRLPLFLIALKAVVNQMLPVRPLLIKTPFSSSNTFFRYGDRLVLQSERDWLDARIIYGIKRRVRVARVRVSRGCVNVRKRELA
jgi:hypothetical protein